jgi:hypothetical protein
MDNQHIRLTSAELGNLWQLYMIESLLIPFKIPVIETCKDEEIRSLFQTALVMSQTYVKEIEKLYEKENHAIPIGFSEKDMNASAPALFSDTFVLHYIHDMAKLGLRLIPQMMETTTRQDMLDILYVAYGDYKKLYQNSLTVLLSKGLYSRSASIPIPKKVELIKKQHYLAGWFGKQRPLNAIEIMHLHYTIHRNTISKTLLLGFSQVVKDKEIRQYMKRGVDITSQIISDLQAVLIKENINTPSTLDSELFDTTIPPYSKRLMLTHIATMGSGSIGIYGNALGTVSRKDIAAKIMIIIKDALQYSEDGVNLLIEREWLEKPPGLTDTEN